MKKLPTLNPLGYSMYLSTYQQQIEKLSPSSEGESLIFISLHMPEEMDGDYAKKCRTMLGRLRGLGYRIIADVSRRSLEVFEVKSLEELREKLDLDILRIDYGFSEEEIRHYAKRHPVGINASLVTKDSVGTLFEDALEVYAMHNFYPRPETGLDVEQFESLNALLKEKGLKVLSFIPGDILLRGPIHEGLPTLEIHRGMAPYATFMDMYLRFGMDYVFVGDGIIQKDEEEWIRAYLREKVLTLPVVFNEKAEILSGKDYTIRKDSPKNLMRLQESREYATFEEKIEPDPTVRRERGSVTLDNLRYKRYSGEIQITKEEFPEDDRVNVIGHVPKKYQLLLDLIPNGGKIRFQGITE